MSCGGVSTAWLRRTGHPDQIAGVLRNEGIGICKQTIYNHVHADRSGKLAQHMPHELKYTCRMRKQPVTRASNIKDRTSIHERPKEAYGKRFGGWEMDTIVGSYGKGRGEDRRLLYGFLLIMAERRYQERQQAYPEIHSQESRL